MPVEISHHSISIFLLVNVNYLNRCFLSVPISAEDVETLRQILLIPEGKQPEISFRYQKQTLAGKILKKHNRTYTFFVPLSYEIAREMREQIVSSPYCYLKLKIKQNAENQIKLSIKQRSALHSGNKQEQLPKRGCLKEGVYITLEKRLRDSDISRYTREEGTFFVLHQSDIAYLKQVLPPDTMTFPVSYKRKTGTGTWFQIEGGSINILGISNLDEIPLGDEKVGYLLRKHEEKETFLFTPYTRYTEKTECGSVSEELEKPEKEYGSLKKEKGKKSKKRSKKKKAKKSK